MGNSGSITLMGDFADFATVPVPGTGSMGLVDFINALDVHLFNINAGGSDSRFDFNKNGSVNATDMAILIGNLNKGGWGR